jgi:predicted HTH domain antitoxin
MKPRIDYPTEVLWALQQEPGEFEREARMILARDLFKSGRLSTGLAAKLAGLSKEHFMFEMSRFGISPFGTTVPELADDLAAARQASRHQ